MPFYGKIYLMIILAATALTSGACSGNNNIPSVAPPAAQAVPTQPEPTSELKIEPKAERKTELKTELVEPISPVSPVKQPAGAQSIVVPLKGSETALTAAITDLSRQAGVSSNQISLVAIEAKEWGDTSLGCPQEGMMYAQVITPGYLITLAAQGKQYIYHTDTQINVVWCKK
jgi:hypothetical protein